MTIAPSNPPVIWNPLDRENVSPFRILSIHKRLVRYELLMLDCAGVLC